MTTAPSYDVIVIGGGISGLASAHWLKASGHSVLVLERDSAPGGTMKSVRERGYLVETGPNSALETTSLFRELVRDCGLEHEFQYADPAGKNRFILRDGRMHALPLGPFSFLTTPLFSVRAKLRLLAEPFIGRAREEESVAQFVSRRLGTEFLDYAIDPFVAGVFAGKPELLSVRSAFPKLYALEEKYGGLIRGMIGGARERKQRAEKAKDRAESFSFKNGMHALPMALARSLGEGFRPSAIVRHFDHTSGIYHVVADVNGEPQTFQARTLVVAVPAYAAAGLLAPLSDEASSILRSIEYSPVASVFVGYKRKDVPHALDGFGVLIPQKENRKILGALWSSSLFPGRSPEDVAAFTVFVGGGRQPEELNGTDEAVYARARKELEAIMHIVGNPVYYRVTRWEKAIPQYTLGYGRKMDALSASLAPHPGLALCSNYLGGISVGDCVMSARRTADAINGVLGSGQG